MVDFYYHILYIYTMMQSHLQISEQIKDILQDMRTKVERDSEHVYRNPENGMKYQGVSTVSSIIPKDWLAGWGSKEAVKFLGYTDYANTVPASLMLEKIKNCTVEQYLAILKEAKGSSSRKGRDAMGTGKTGHKWLENLVEARIKGSTIPSIPEDNLKRPIEQFLHWESANIKEWVASEAYVVRPDKFYAGQLDAIAILQTGELALIDFKFASHIDSEYYLQCAGYAACFEPYNIKFHKRLIIRLPKTLEQEVWKDYKYEMVPNNIEVKVVPTNYESDREAFFAALIVKSWINKITNNK